MLRLTKNVNGLNQQRTVKSMKNYSRLFLLHLIALFGVSIPVSGNRYKFLFKAAERKFQDSTIQERNGASKIGSKNFMQRF